MEAPTKGQPAGHFSARVWRPVPQRRSRSGEIARAATDAAAPAAGPPPIISQPSALVPRRASPRLRPRAGGRGRKDRPKAGRLGFHGRRDQVLDIDYVPSTRRRVSRPARIPSHLRGQQEAGIITACTRSPGSVSPDGYFS